MAIYSKNQVMQGKWVKGSEVAQGARCKLLSETKPRESQFQNKDGSPKVQDVAKVQFSGENEPMNISLNRATIDALVDAFGEDSRKWMGNVLTVHTEKVMVGGKRVTAVYLVPEGYQVSEDAGGYIQILKAGAEASDSPVINLDEEPGEEAPF
jgi:hypothetical protein